MRLTVTRFTVGRGEELSAQSLPILPKVGGREAQRCAESPSPPTRFTVGQGCAHPSLSPSPWGYYRGFLTRVLIPVSLVDFPLRWVIPGFLSEGFPPGFKPFPVYF